MKIKTTKKLFIATVLLLAVATGVMNYFTPYLADDYSCVKSARSFFSFRDIAASTWHYYTSWGGRALSHILTMTFAGLPPVVFDLLNTLCYLAVTWLMYLICKGDKKHSISLYIGIHALIWICVPDYGQVMFWMCGSTNYLWTSLPILLLLYLYRNYNLRGEGYLRHPLYTLPLFFLGFIAGFAMENMSVGIIIITTLHLFYYKKKQWKIHIPILSSYVGSLVGFACLIFAPGNQVRAEAEANNAALSVPFKFFIISYYWVTFVGVLCILWLVLFWMNKHLQKEIVSIPYVVGALASAYCMLAAPSSPERTWFIVCVYLILAVGILYRSFEFETSSLNKGIITIVCTGTMIFLFVAMTDTILYSREIFVQTKTREAYILEQKATGNLDITTKIISHQYPFRAQHDGLTGLSDITDDPNYWINQGLADYYGVNSITGVR